MHKRRRRSNIFDTTAYFGPKAKNMTFMSNAICDFVLYLQSEGLNIS